MREQFLRSSATRDATLAELQTYAIAKEVTNENGLKEVHFERRLEM